MSDADDEGRGDNRRHHPRLNVEEDVHATVTDADGNETGVVVRDISAGGAGLIVSGAFRNDTFVDLHMEGIGWVNARVARQFREGIGVEFNLNERERAEVEKELIKFRKAGGRGAY